MSSSNADDPLPELPTVSTETRDGPTIVTIVTEGSMRLRVNLNNRALFDDIVSEALGDAGGNQRD